MTKTHPYSRRLTKWFCDCGKEHASEALAWACECYRPKVVCDHAAICGNAKCQERSPHRQDSLCERGECSLTGYEVRCKPVEAKEVGDGKN